MLNENVQAQLKKMILFIEQEGEEKASEIMAKANEDFALEKIRLVQQGKEKIQKDFDAKEKNVEVKRKIAYSNVLNANRLRLLEEREKAIQAVLMEALDRIVELGKPTPAYKELLKKLVTEGLLKLREPNVTIVCRKEDLQMVREVLDDAMKDYEKKSGGQACNAIISEEHFLAPSKKSADQGHFCTGGVLLTANQGKIVCSNTLDDRLALAYNLKLPEIRRILFGMNANRRFLD